MDSSFFPFPVRTSARLINPGVRPTEENHYKVDAPTISITNPIVVNHCPVILCPFHPDLDSLPYNQNTPKSIRLLSPTYFHSHSCLIMSRTERPISPFIIRNRYFGHQTRWYLHSQTACDNFLKSPNEYLLGWIGSPTRILARYPFGRTQYSLTYPQSKAWTISLADGLRG